MVLDKYCTVRIVPTLPIGGSTCRRLPIDLRTSLRPIGQSTPHSCSSFNLYVFLFIVYVYGLTL
jgi:hypothetical protein